MIKRLKPTATSRRSGITGAGRDGRKGISKGTAGTFITTNRAGIRLPNEDVGNAITLEEYRREGR